MKGKIICYQHEFGNNLLMFPLNAPVIIRAKVKKKKNNAIKNNLAIPTTPMYDKAGYQYKVGALSCLR